MTTAPRRRGRPPRSSPAAVEAVALGLMLRDGYEAATVEAISDAAGVGRTTFFRYFGSKSGVVWAEFERAIERLRNGLEVPGAATIMRTVQAAVVESTVEARDASDSWLARFVLLDRDPALTGEAAAHWQAWAATIAAYVEDRGAAASTRALAAAIGGAVQAVYVVVLRDWSSSSLAEVDVDDLRLALEPLVKAFDDLLRS
ncbi:TetR family transcriptional regulator [Aeromicrobium endophyticum]|nr:TetR family transcriptional regulator [Aeromicrobium endophyticum]